MNRFVAPLALLLLLSANALAADSLLAAWEFNRPGDAEDWYAAHAMAKPSVSGGYLRSRATSGDPYLVLGGTPLPIEANDFQYIEIRMRTNVDGGAEFFWSQATADGEAGFVAGKERAFAIKAGSDFRTYRVYPGWSGRIRRLRLDVPDGCAVAIDYIRVMQATPSSHDAASPRWDFRSDAGGFVPTSGCQASAEREGLKVTLEDSHAFLTGPVLSLATNDYRRAAIHLTSSARVQGLLHWSNTDDGSFAGSSVAVFDIEPGEAWVTVDLAAIGAWSGPFRRVALGFVGKETDNVVVHSLAFTAGPAGPARLRVLSLGARSRLAQVGETVTMEAHVRNDGAAPVVGLRATLVLPSSIKAVDGVDLAAGDIAPGEEKRLQWGLRCAGDGPAALRAVFAAQGLARAAAASTQLIVTRRAPALRTPVKGTYARAEANSAVIGNEHVRLQFLRSSPGLRVARLEMLARGQARLMGVLPAPVRLAIGNEREAAPVTVEAVKIESGGASSRLVLRGSRAGVTVEISYAARSGLPWIDVSYRLTSARPILLRAMHGPWLWAGEGAFGAEQDRALFPGVEWLVKGERSSSTLDIAPPMHTRFAPHPNWVTVPSMAVQKERDIVGIVWDPLQKWDGVRTRPGAAFASPDFIDASPSSLMGLFLPSIPEFCKANTLIAARPYRLTPGRALTLRAALFAKTASDVTEAPMLWYRWRIGSQKPPALPPLPRTYAETLVMGMRAYESVLWQPKAQGWMPVIGWAPGRDPSAAAIYDTVARVLPDRTEAPAWRKRAVAVGGSGDNLTFALRGSGSPEVAMRSVLAMGRSLAASQPEGARYVFRGDGQRKMLGADGETAVGIASATVEQLLSMAMRTGDAVALEAGLKGLAFMDQFDVPRAAQVWECPLHSPDILASGQACRAYLAAYRMTGDRKFLRRAVYWARTGLPFVYAWQAPDMPALMKYATIPIFGATFYTGSWFGVPVQWNGLDYADACLELAPFDPTFDWRAVGEGITISAMNQQSTRTADYGTYTDNWNLVTNIECVGCMLAPGAIMTNVLKLLGTRATAGVGGVRSPQGWVAVNGPGPVSDVRLRDGVLQARATYFPSTVGMVAVMPIGKPTGVSVGGVAYRERRSGPPAPGEWAYSAGIGMLTIAIRFAAPTAITVKGVERLEIDVNQTEWRFGDERGALGWWPENHLAPPAFTDVAMRLEFTGDDAYITGPEIAVASTKATGVALSARVSKAGGEVYWGTTNGPISAERRASFDLPADGLFHEVRIDLSSHPEWRGDIRRLRLDFNGGKGDSVELRWVKLIVP